MKKTKHIDTTAASLAAPADGRPTVTGWPSVVASTVRNVRATHATPARGKNPADATRALDRFLRAFYRHADASSRRTCARISSYITYYDVIKPRPRSIPTVSHLSTIKRLMQLRVKKIKNILLNMPSQKLIR